MKQPCVGGGGYACIPPTDAGPSWLAPDVCCQAVGHIIFPMSPLWEVTWCDGASPKALGSFLAWKTSQMTCSKATERAWVWALWETPGPPSEQSWSSREFVVV